MHLPCVVALALLGCSDTGPGAGEPPEWVPPKVSWPDPDESTDPFLLSQTGMYTDISADTLAPDLVPFEPGAVLWSDSATKRRWVRLPKGRQIDSKDMDNWSLPVGTVFFKEFTRDDVRVETRIITRLDDERFWMGAFVWKKDGSDAVFRPGGEENARGTEHDVPEVKRCGTCHNGEPSRSLGFSAVQLGRADADSLLEQLAKDDRLTHPPKDASEYGPPGDGAEQRALGYLHANCGHCHNPRGSARPDTDLTLRLRATDREPEDTLTYQTAIDGEVDSFPGEGIRVVPGDPDASILLTRMKHRQDNTQMPPLATERVDTAGVKLVANWIRAL